MDARITKSRLSRVLSYDWFKILILVVAIAFFWSLLFTMGAPRASVGQTFDLFVYSDFSGKSEGEVLNEASENGAFSYDVLKFGTRSLSKDYYNTVLSAVITTYEGDIMITSDFQDAIDKNESRARAFVDSYGNIVYDIPSLVADAKNYCVSNGMVAAVSPDGDEEAGYILDEAAVERVFRARMKNDPRFRTEEKKREGIKKEIARVKKVWNDAINVENLITAHPEALWNYERFDQTANAETDEKRKSEYEKLKEDGGGVKVYGINLGALTGGEKEITSLYSKATYNEKNEIVSTSADGIIVLAFNYKSQQPHLQYETLGFINYILKTYSNFVTADNRLIA